MSDISRAEMITFAQDCYIQCQEHNPKKPLAAIAMAGARVYLNKNLSKEVRKEFKKLVEIMEESNFTVQQKTSYNS